MAVGRAPPRSGAAVSRASRCGRPPLHRLHVSPSPGRPRRHRGRRVVDQIDDRRPRWCRSTLPGSPSRLPATTLGAAAWSAAGLGSASYSTMRRPATPSFGQVGGCLTAVMRPGKRGSASRSSPRRRGLGHAPPRASSNVCWSRRSTSLPAIGGASVPHPGRQIVAAASTAVDARRRSIRRGRRASIGTPDPSDSDHRPRSTRPAMRRWQTVGSSSGLRDDRDGRIDDVGTRGDRSATSARDRADVPDSVWPRVARGRRCDAPGASERSTVRPRR